MECDTTDKKDKLYLIIGLEKSWKYYWMKKMLQNNT